MAENVKPEAVERLNNLGHLASGVGHHVINAFSAIVSNAELLRLKPPRFRPRSTRARWPKRSSAPRSRPRPWRDA